MFWQNDPFLLDIDLFFGVLDRIEKPLKLITTIFYFLKDLFGKKIILNLLLYNKNLHSVKLMYIEVSE